MQCLYSVDPQRIKYEEHKEARAEMQKWLERDEIIWRQRPKALWLN